MKNNKTFIAISVGFVMLCLPMSRAQAQDLPLLTWEKGKIQSVVLGGQSDSSRWQVYLKSENGELIELSQSSSNKNGFSVYTLNVPRELKGGSYSVITSGERSPETIVAAVQVVEMQKYAIAQIPGDLIFILLSIAFWFATLGALRGIRYRNISLISSTGPKERYLSGEPTQSYIEHVYKFVPLEKLRIRIYEQVPDSFFKFLLKSDSGGLHLNFPWVWSLLPGLSILLAAVTGYLSASKYELSPSSQLKLLIIILAFVGSADLYSGIIAAISFFVVRIWLLPEFSVGSTLSTIAIGLIFFLPALLSSYFSALLSKDDKNSSKYFINSLLYNWISPILMVHSLFLINRSITGSVESTFGFEIILISVIWAARFSVTLLSSSSLFFRRTPVIAEEVDLTIGRLISPSFAAIMWLFFSTLLYMWTYKGWTSLILGGLICLPIFLLLIRPTWKLLSVINKVKRNHLIEVSIVLALLISSLEFARSLPVIISANPNLLILIGISPVILHSIFSFTHDLGVADKAKADAQ